MSRSLSPPEFFIDRSLGRHVVAARLCAAGVSPSSKEDDYSRERTCATISSEVIDTNGKTPKLEIGFVGPAAEGGRLRLDVLVETAHAVQTAVTRLAYGLRGQATVRRGRTPREIADVTRLELVGLREGSTVLVFDLAAQERPLHGFDLGVEALEAFEAGLVSVAAGTPPPEPWDEGVMEAVERMTRALDRGIDEIVVGRPGAVRSERAVFTRQTGGLLPIKGPGVQERAEIEGRLLMADFAAARDQARIHRPLGPPVRCTFGHELERDVLRLLRRYVRARGLAELNEHGEIRVLELESLEDAELSAGRSFWDLPTLDELAAEQGVKAVARIEDLADGTWPEEESLDDFLAAIESRS